MTGLSPVDRPLLLINVRTMRRFLTTNVGSASIESVEGRCAAKRRTLHVPNLLSAAFAEADRAVRGQASC
jgi:hypothetical protein